MRLPPFPSIKKGLSFGEVNPLLGHSIYHSSNQYLTHLFSQVFNHTIIVHFGRGEKEREKGVLYICMVFFAIHLDQFHIFQCSCIFRVLSCFKETPNSEEKSHFTPIGESEEKMPRKYLAALRETRGESRI